MPRSLETENDAGHAHALEAAGRLSSGRGCFLCLGNGPFVKKQGEFAADLLHMPLSRER